MSIDVLLNNQMLALRLAQAPRARLGQLLVRAVHELRTIFRDAQTFGIQRGVPEAALLIRPRRHDAEVIRGRAQNIKRCEQSSDMHVHV